MNWHRQLQPLYSLSYSSSYFTSSLFVYHSLHTCLPWVTSVPFQTGSVDTLPDSQIPGVLQWAMVRGPYMENKLKVKTACKCNACTQCGGYHQRTSSKLRFISLVLISVAAKTAGCGASRVWASLNAPRRAADKQSLLTVAVPCNDNVTLIKGKNKIKAD